eukprot:NODE_704_length_4999_cov_0.292653.p3 type:complete len:390 gc:universal NODE_704_length_4999_cov_0.292653:584-1753(+)
MIFASLLVALQVSNRVLVRIPAEYATVDMDIWKQLEDEVEIFINPDDIFEIPHVVVDDEVEKRAVEEHKRLLTRTKSADTTLSSFFSDFNDIDSIISFYDQLKAEYPQFVKKVNFGKSVLNRDMVAYHITSSSSRPKKQVMLMSLIHAREWLSAPVVAYTVLNMIQDNSNLLDLLELVVVPVANPDGYVHTWTKDRYWRKNLGSNGGVDLNRNFDIKWSEKGGASTNPRSDAYRGPFAFSEPETVNLRNYYASLKTVVGAIDFHCFSQLILRPLGYVGISEHESVLKELGDKMSKAIFSVDKKNYKSVRIIDLYMATGSGIDYFYSQKRLVDGLIVRPYAMAFELRPGSLGGDFVVDPSLILPTAKEIYAANLEYFTAVLSRPLNSTFT